MASTTPVPREEVVRFLERFAEASCRGEGVLPTLRRLAGETPEGEFHDVIEALARDVDKGGMLSASMAKHPAFFRPGVVALVSGGEIAGVLDEALLLILRCAWRGEGDMFGGA